MLKATSRTLTATLLGFALAGFAFSGAGAQTQAKTKNMSPNNGAAHQNHRCYQGPDGKVHCGK